MDDNFRAADIARELAEQPESPVAGSSDGWPDPQPLPDELPPVMPFEFDLLPTSLRPWVEDISERVQCPPDFVAVAAMLVLATVIGRKVGIRSKRQDDWTVVPNLFGAAVGPPSMMKSPAIREVLKPLKRLEIEKKEEFDKAAVDHQAQSLVAEQRRAIAKANIRAALKDETGDAFQVARDALCQEGDQPTRRRYLVNDSTVEKLGELLNENPNGVLCYRDELISLLKSLDKEGQEGARGFYLEAWDGTGRYSYDRIGRGNIDIEATIVSLFGSIQPGPLRSYLHAAVKGGDGADGLMQRFQLAVYPDGAKEWRNVDRWPDTAARTTAYETVRRLARMEPAEVGAERDEGDPDSIPFLRFDHAAQNLFDEWRSKLEPRLRSGTEHPVLEAHLAKYRSLIPSLALLIHLAEGGSGSIGYAALERALRWRRYLESHARRIYAAAIAPDTMEAVALAQKIMSGEVPDEFALRDIYRHNWIGLNTREAAARAVEMLCDLDWLDEAEERTTGRPRKRYLVNPKVHEHARKRTDKTDKSPPG